MSCESKVSMLTFRFFQNSQKDILLKSPISILHFRQNILACMINIPPRAFQLTVLLPEQARALPAPGGPGQQ